MYGINNAGQVPGILYSPGSSGQLFVTSPTGTINIPVIEPLQANAINNAGQVVGNVGGGNVAFQAFIASTAGSTLLPATQGFTPFEAFGVNDSGQIAGYATNSANNQQPYIWSTGGTSLIPLPAGWTSGIGTAINNNGQVAGFGNLPSSFTQPFIGTPAGSTPIPVPPATPFVMAYALNDSGQLAGFVQNGQALIGTTSGITLIPLPSGSARFSYATVSHGSLNNSGVVVGQVSNQTGTVVSGWIWDAGQGTVSLNNLVPSGWFIYNAVSISDTGLILAQASYNNGPTLWVELSSMAGACTYSISPSNVSVTGIGGTSSFTVNTSPGCNWQASSTDTTWLTVNPPGTGSGSGTVSFQFTTNTGALPLSAVITAGSALFTVTQAPIGLEPIGITNAYGNGTTQTFTFNFADPNVFQGSKVMDILINDYLDGQNACYIAVVPVITNIAGYVYLVDDAGDGGYASGSPMVLPSTGVLQNSQCSINGAPSIILDNAGLGWSVILSITFKPGFVGNKIIYMAIRSNGTNSGWQAMGTWNVPGSTSSGPAVGGVSPGRSSISSGVFSFTFTDSNGYQDLGVLDILTNSFLDGISACYVAYVPTTATDGYLYLVDDAGDGGYARGSPMLLSSGGTLQNSQCTINAAQSSATANGNTLTLNLAMVFSSSFVGNQVFYLAARNNSGGNSGWQAVGSVTVP
jgi:hypothetical protein